MSKLGKFVVEQTDDVVWRLGGDQDIHEVCTVRSTAIVTTEPSQLTEIPMHKHRRHFVHTERLKLSGHMRVQPALHTPGDARAQCIPFRAPTAQHRVNLGEAPLLLEKGRVVLCGSVEWSIGDVRRDGDLGKVRRLRRESQSAKAYLCRKRRRSERLRCCAQSRLKASSSLQ